MIRRVGNTLSAFAVVGLAATTGCTTVEGKPAPPPTVAQQPETSKASLVRDFDAAVRNTARNIACILAQPEIGATPGGSDTYTNLAANSTLDAIAARTNGTDYRHLSTSAPAMVSFVASNLLPKPESLYFSGQLNPESLAAGTTDMERGISLAATPVVGVPTGTVVLFERDGSGAEEDIHIQILDPETGMTIARDPTPASREELDEFIQWANDNVSYAASVGGVASAACLTQANRPESNL